MQHYDHIVVGGGISGLTASLLLARQDNRVLLVEKNDRLGGSVGRFRRRGIPFDVGFHFTGGFGHNSFGMLGDMLRVLGLRESIDPVMYPQECCHRVAFSALDSMYSVPQGVGPLRKKLKEYFPREKSGIDEYYDRFLSVCDQTASMDVRSMGQQPPAMEEDFVTLQDVLDQHCDDPVLQALLSAYCTCHGTPPDSVSFAAHTRITAGMQESTARVKGGGQAFVDAFQEALASLPVDLRCGCTIEALEDISDRRVERFVLSDGDVVSADQCLFTINPKNILEILPEEHLSCAFQNRVEDFEPTLGFFSLFGRMQNTGQDIPQTRPIFTVLPGTDFNRLMSPEGEGDRPMVVIFSRENVGGKAIQTVTVLEVSFFEDVRRWADTMTGDRGPGYAAYKKRRGERMLEKLEGFWPRFRSDFELVESASMLTYRDYLNTPYGAAYGIKQKVGQFNVIGKLPLTNLYAAGQSALLPGVVGAMASAFVVCRSLIGKVRLQKFIENRLCH